MTRIASRPRPVTAVRTGSDIPEWEIHGESPGPSGLLADLNRMLADEHGCAIRYATHAALVAGPFAGPVSERLLEIAADETRHAARLRERICALGGRPTMEATRGRLPRSLSLDEILDQNLREEGEAIGRYHKLLDSIPASEIRLRRTIEDILLDEEEHREELGALKVPGGSACACMQARAGAFLPDGVDFLPPDRHPSDGPRG